MDADMRIAQLAERQLGLVSRRQALEAGLSRRSIQGRCGDGRWRRVRRGVYALAGIPPSPEQQVLAACLSVDGSLASHDTALAFHLDRRPAGPIELTIVGERHLELPGVTVHRTRSLSALDRAQIRRIPVTSAERLVVDLSGRRSVGELGHVVDELRRRRRLSLRRLAACLARLEAGPGRRAALVHEVLRARLDGSAPAESAWEDRVAELLVAAGLPRPVKQYEVAIDGVQYRADLAYPDEGLIIELDSWEWHQSQRSFHGDRQRLSRMVGAGHRVLTLTARMDDDELVGLVAQALRASRAQSA